MPKSNKLLLEETEKLKKENKELQQKLREVSKYIDVGKIKTIDALVIANENKLKIYTERTADKPYRILIEKMHEGAVTVNKDGTILYANSYFASMVNLPLSKVIGTKFKNLISDTLPESVDDLFEKAWQNPIKKEVHLSANKGNVLAVLMTVNALSVDDNFLLSIILTDLTIQKKNQVELKHRSSELEQKNGELESANKDLTAFTYVSSHDLQEPLRKIQLFVNCLLKDENENLSDSGKNYLQRTYETTKGMRALIEDLLEYSRSKNAKGKFEKTDLTVILDEVRNEFKEEILEKKATIEGTNLGDANIIRFQFRQLLHNLINNSLKFAKPQTVPSIIIKSQIVRGSELKPNGLNHSGSALPAEKSEAGALSSKIDYCHITYTDNGIGFDPKYKDRIFGVFQRLHSREEYKGTGIGLAICKRIVENHHGIISATGKVNKGARFDIYIPAV